MSEFRRVNNKAKVRLLTGDSRGRIEDLAETDIVVGELSLVLLSNDLNLSKFETVVLDGHLSLGTKKNMSSKAARERIHAEFCLKHGGAPCCDHCRRKANDVFSWPIHP
jgi:hypothetical protein